MNRSSYRAGINCSITGVSIEPQLDDEKFISAKNRRRSELALLNFFEQLKR
jgi:hypothetical protein